MFVVFEDGEARYVFEDAVFYSGFYDRFLVHSLLDEETMDCGDYDLSGIKSEWNLSGYIQESYLVNVSGEKMRRVAEKLYGSGEGGGIRHSDFEVYAVFVGGDTYFLFSDDRSDCFSERELTTTNGSLMEHQKVEKQVKAGSSVCVLKLIKNPESGNYVVYRSF